MQNVLAPRRPFQVGNAIVSKCRHLLRLPRFFFGTVPYQTNTKGVMPSFSFYRGSRRSRRSGKVRRNRRISHKSMSKRLKSSRKPHTSRAPQRYRNTEFTCSATVDSEGQASAECVNLDDIESLRSSLEFINGERMDILRGLKIVETSTRDFEIGPFLRQEYQYHPFNVRIFKIHAKSREILQKWLDGSNNYFVYPGTGLIVQNQGRA